MDCTRALIRAVGDFAADYLPSKTEFCVGLSGGPDSLALTGAAVRAGFKVQALIVDHGLQGNSAQVAQRAAALAVELGAVAQILTVRVGSDGGPEAAARSARYAALDEARAGQPVLLAHTLDDQAETVLLGLGRGSGARSLAGMAPWREPWGRPLLGLRRADTVAACVEFGVEPWDDPHNRDLRFTRVRLRHEVLPLLDEVLQGGVAPALARTADALRRDTEALDEIAAQRYSDYATESGLPVAALDTHPATASRVLRRWLIDSGATDPTARVMEAAAALAAGGAGEVAIGGDPRHRLVVVRTGGRLVVQPRPR